MRPNPGLSITPGVPSPCLMGLEFVIPVVTAGKRRYQIEAAQSLGDAARLNLAQTAWTVRSAVRTALLNLMVADQSQSLWRTEVRLKSERVTRLGEQLTSGVIARPIVASARIDCLNARLAARAAEGRATQAKAALAGDRGELRRPKACAAFVAERFD
jgi:cobalt-zinc-cadmium efflux system outer membrane protein